MVIAFFDLEICEARLWTLLELNDMNENQEGGAEVLAMETSEEFLQMRKNKKVFSEVMVGLFLERIVGVSTYKAKMKAGVTVSQTATVSDEALVLLLIENNEELWMEQGKHK